LHGRGSASATRTAVTSVACPSAGGNWDCASRAFDVRSPGSCMKLGHVHPGHTWQRSAHTAIFHRTRHDPAVLWCSSLSRLERARDSACVLGCVLLLEDGNLERRFHHGTACARRCSESTYFFIVRCSLYPPCSFVRPERTVPWTSLQFCCAKLNTLNITLCNGIALLILHSDIRTPRSLPRTVFSFAGRKTSGHGRYCCTVARTGNIEEET
jgi:hypothetical protein